MAPSDVPTLFSARAGFFNDALLFTHRDQALAGLPPLAELGLGLGFQGLGIQEEIVKPLDAGIVRDFTDESSLQNWSCHGCGSSFQSLEEQRSHFKSDFHKFNVKRQLAGKVALNEDEFEQVAQGDADDVSSISGSDTESESEDNSSFSRGPRSNQLYIKLKESEDVICIWRALVAADKEVLPGEKGHAVDESTSAESLYLNEEEVLRRLRALTDREKKSVWVVLLAVGGHFAGLVLSSEDGSVVAHKTYHRYVVRAKAGGRQSTKDGGGRAPQSAGASLRRYNEQALQKEIRGLLTLWSEHLQSASHIFVYAPSSNAQTLFGGENVVLDRNDRRIRKIPFTIRRPTLKEAKRISFLLSLFQKLDSLAFSVTPGIHDGVLRGEDSCNQAGKPLGKKKAKPHQVENPVAAEQLEDTTKGLEEDLGFTPLHVAAKAGDTDGVRNLLEEDSDPCLKDKAGRTPYSIAKDKETRNIFRRFMAQHPSKWDWHAASVPSPLTDELEAAQLAKQAEKDAKRKAKEKERKKLKKAEERAKQAQAEARAAEVAAEEAARAAAASVRYDKNRVKEMFSTSAKLLDPNSKEYQEAMLKAQAQERETRAAAAEFRLRALASSSQPPSAPASTNSGSFSSTAPQNICTCCRASLAGKVPFTRYSYQYCSTTCVRVHKMALEEG